MEIIDFIKTRPYLVWYSKSYHTMSEGVIIESVLNYGSWEDFQELVKILGIKKIALIFRQSISLERCNYRPEVKNYFTLYFNRYA
ncbi:hypothetical protein M1145_00040 [Patescibacteria group bacterium]|nr:hypothetical protein [Patescibacteria group bacterium]